MAETDTYESGVLTELDFTVEGESRAVPVPAAFDVGDGQLDVMQSADLADGPVVLDDDTGVDHVTGVLVHEGLVRIGGHVAAGRVEVREVEYGDVLMVVGEPADVVTVPQGDDLGNGAQRLHRGAEAGPGRGVGAGGPSVGDNLTKLSNSLY